MLRVIGASGLAVVCGSIGDSLAIGRAEAASCNGPSSGVHYANDGALRKDAGGEVQASVARCLRTPPYAARRKGLVSATRTAYAARAIAGARLSLATVLLHR